MRRFLFGLFLVVLLPFSARAADSAPSKIPMVAVMPFTGRSLDADALETVSAALGSDLLNTGKFRVMERSQMQAILKEQNFQQSGACDGSECAVEIGKLLSVDHMVVGTVGKVGGTYVVTTRLVSVQTGEVLKSVTKTSKAEVDAIVTDVLPKLAQDLSVRESTPVAVAPVPTPVAASRPDSSAAPVATPSGSGRHWGWWVAGGVVVAGGAAAAILLTQSSNSASTTVASNSSSSTTQTIHMVEP